MNPFVSKNTACRSYPDTKDLEQEYLDAIDGGSRSVVFKGLDLRRRIFSAMDFRCCVWIECDLTGAQFVACDLRGADFAASRLTDSHFEQCLLYGSKVPEDQTIQFRDCIFRLS
jgi:uncharacterized protein YjbI with pentapeptide repeats